MKWELTYRFADKVRAWQTKYLSQVDLVHFMAIIIGLMCGFAAGLLKNGIQFVTHLVFGHFHLTQLNIPFFVLPLAGIFLATLFTIFVIRQPMDHASERIVEGIAQGNYSLKPRMILGPIIGCSITLGLGGSAGAEDPIAYSGAAIGSNVGKAFRMPPDIIGQMVGCGAAAAIAAIFMAPIGGVMFAMEVLKMRQSLRTVLAIVLSSLVAALTCFIMMGCHTDVTFVPEMRFDLHLVPWVLACGAVCGIYSIYYNAMMAWSRRVLQSIKNRWWRALAGGTVLAVLIVIFPSLYGEGYNTVGRLMVDDPQFVVSYGPLYPLSRHFDVLLLLMAAVLLVKPFATSATNDSGGVGGDFTPTFFCGGVLGFLFAVALNHFFDLSLPYAIFAFFGMAAVMSGTVRAPLMAIFIAAEMTGLYGFILPLTIAAIVSFVTSLVITHIFKRPHPASTSRPTPPTTSTTPTT